MCPVEYHHDLLLSDHGVSSRQHMMMTFTCRYFRPLKDYSRIDPLRHPLKPPRTHRESTKRGFVSDGGLCLDILHNDCM